jgi:hypothetical protein
VPHHHTLENTVTGPSDDSVSMLSAVLEVHRDSWKARAFEAFDVPILSRPHTISGLARGLNSSRILFWRLHGSEAGRVTRFFDREVRGGELTRHLEVKAIPGGVHVVIIGKGPSIEDVLGKERYLAPQLMLRGSILAVAKKEVFRAFYHDKSTLQHLVADLWDFSEDVKLASEEAVRATSADLFPPPLESAPSFTPVDTKVAVTALSRGYFDRGPRKVSQDDLARELGMSKKSLNGRLRDLSRVGLQAMLSPSPPPAEIVRRAIADLRKGSS